MNIVSLLKEKGFRVTKPRLEIIKVLSNYPLSAEEIHDALDKKNIRVDLASVYRSLELFVKMSVVYSIELGEGKKRYELVNKNYHHHHLICNIKISLRISRICIKAQMQHQMQSNATS